MIKLKAIPIEQVAIEITKIDDTTEDFTLEAPNADEESMFIFGYEPVELYPNFRDDNYFLQDGVRYWRFVCEFSYDSHRMDTRPLLAAKKIAVKTPPEFGDTDNYQTHDVMFDNNNSQRGFFRGLAMGGGTDFSIPNTGGTLRFVGTQAIDAAALVEEEQWDQPAVSCDLEISSVDVSGDIVTVNASSSYSNIEYSVWNSSGDTLLFGWQSSNEFTIESEDSYLARVRDDGDCSDEMSFATLPADISFVDDSGVDIQSSSTTSTVTIPASVEEGDFLVLHIMHRDTLTLPSGWTLIETTSPTFIDFNQIESVAYKIAGASDGGTDITTTQASSNRMVTHIVAFEGDKEIEVKQSESDQATSSGLTVPELTANADNRMALVSMTNVFAQVSGTETVEYNDATYNQTTPITIEQNRLGAAHKLLNNGDTVSGRFENQSEDTDRTAISILIGYV